MFTSTIWTFFVPPALLAMIYLLRRPSGRWQQFAVDYPKLRAGLIGGLLLAVLGFAVNDSGIVIPAVILSFLVPMALLVHLAMEAPNLWRAVPAESEVADGPARAAWPRSWRRVSGLTGFVAGSARAFEWPSPRPLDPSLSWSHERQSSARFPSCSVSVAVRNHRRSICTHVHHSRSTDDPSIGLPVAATLVIAVVAVMFAAGLFDDLRGDEKARGFRGHMSSASGGALTGGAGQDRRGWHRRSDRDHPRRWPGSQGRGVPARCAHGQPLQPSRPGPGPSRSRSRSSFFVPLMALGPAGLAVGMAGLAGALVAVGPADLRERAMLGDAGANPIGAVVGSGPGLFLSTTPSGCLRCS